jgi:tetratricopeptide (TPR) repeat protein
MSISLRALCLVLLCGSVLPTTSVGKKVAAPPAAIAEASLDPTHGKESEVALPAVAGRFLGLLRSDPQEQDSRTLEIIDAFIAQRQIEPGRKLAASIAGYQRQVALYRLAVEASRLGHRDSAEEMVRESEGLGDGRRDIEIQEIAAARAECLGALGRLEEARKTLDRINQPAVRNQTEAALFAYEDPAEAEARAAEFSKREKMTPGLRGKALLLIAEGMLRAGRKEAAGTLGQTAVESIVAKADIETIPLLRRAVAHFKKLEDPKQAARWAEVCLGFAERTDRRAYWKCRDLRLAAEAFLDAGEKEKAAEICKAIPNCVRFLDPFDYSRGGMEAAQAFLLGEEPQRFHEAAVHILKQLRPLPNFVARTKTGLDVLAGYIRTGTALPPEVRAELEATAQSIESDPQFRNPI